MGRYIDWADVVGRYPDAAKIAGADSVGSYWMQYAEAEVDARLGVRFTVPFSTAPTLVKDIAIDLTYYRMTLRQKGSEVIKAYVDERLKGLVDGTIYVSGDTGEKAVAWSEQDKAGYHTVFGPDNETYWRSSSAFITDVRGERGQDDIY